MDLSGTSSTGRSPSPQRFISLQRSPSPPPRSPSPAPRSPTPPRYSPSPPPRSPSPPPRSPSPRERSQSSHRSPFRSPSRHSSPSRSPLKSPSRSPSSRLSRHSPRHSSGAAFQHVSRSPSRRSHNSGRRSPSLDESKRGRSPSRHSSRQSLGRSRSGFRRSNKQQQQNVKATGWSPTFSHQSVRTTPRPPSPNISPRSSHPSLRSESSHQSQSQNQHINQQYDQHNDMRRGNVTQNAYITQPTVRAASYISESLERDRSRQRQREWARERELERAHERQLNNSHWHNLSNPTSYGSSVYGDVRSRGRREYGYGPGVMGDLSTGPHGFDGVGWGRYYDDEGRWDEDPWNDVDRLLDPGTRERTGRNLWRFSRRRRRSGDEYVYGNSSTRRSRCRDGGGALGLATIATGLIGLAAGTSEDYAGAQATNNRYTGALGDYRRPRPPRRNRDRSSVQPLVELVTNRPDNPNHTHIERSPSRERSLSGELTRSCHRRNTIEGSPSREEFFTAYDRPRRPSRTRDKDWPHFPPTLPIPPPTLSSNPLSYTSSSAAGSVDGLRAPPDGVDRGKDAAVDPAALPAVTTSKAEVQRKVSTKKISSHDKSSEKTSRPERSVNASTDYPPRDLPVREDNLGGANTTYYDQSYQPASGGGATETTTPSVGYMGPSQTAGTVRTVGGSGEGEGLNLEKTGTRMARLRARLCGSINVPAA